jgi:predicted protein tyrosine phosphatase
MFRVYANLYCGNDEDYLNLEKECVPGEVDQPTNGWAVLHACKESYHRSFVGYTTRGCPKDSQEYFWAERGNRLALNIVDAPKPEFFAKEMIDKALEFIDQKLNEGYKVLVHCNQGESRSPSLCLLYMVSKGLFGQEVDFEKAEEAFRNIYPSYNPGSGIREFMRLNWGEYIK